MCIPTDDVVTKPFEFEGTRRMKQAGAGTARLEANVDSLIVVPSEELLHYYSPQAALGARQAIAELLGAVRRWRPRNPPLLPHDTQSPLHAA